MFVLFFSNDEMRQIEKKDTGTPSEMAIVNYASALIDTDTLKRNCVFEIPFNSRRKWQLAIFNESTEPNADGECEFRVMMKGASEILAQKCSMIMDESGEQRLYGPGEMETFDVIRVCNYLFIQIPNSH